MITLYTIGFTKKSAEQFFELLKTNHVQQLIDVRINSQSQLAGFAKGPDLAYLIQQICHIPYLHVLDFAPTKELLSKWRDKKIDWKRYTRTYNALIKRRDIITKYPVETLDGTCFLCSEDTPEQCHRRLLAEYIKRHNPTVPVTIMHLT